MPSLSQRSFTFTAVAIASVASNGFAQSTTLQSCTSAGLWAKTDLDFADSYPLDISGDGRYVLMQSDASNLDTPDGFFGNDLFIKDRSTGAIEFAARRTTGEQAQGCWPQGSISEDGRYVAFASIDTHVVPGDFNGKVDVFVHDRLLGTTTRESVHPSGIEGDGASSSPQLTPDAHHIVFVSDSLGLAPNANGLQQVHVRDRLTNAIELASVNAAGQAANALAESPSVSHDGRFVAFDSAATNLVGPDLNGAFDVFVRDRLTGTTQRISTNPGGAAGNASSILPRLSADGRFVAFLSTASDLVPGDTNAANDVFVYDAQLGTLTLGSVSTTGGFPNGFSNTCDLSADGRWLVFGTWASNVVAPDTNANGDVILRDLQLGVNVRAGADWTGGQSSFGTYHPHVSDDGRFVAFWSDGDDLVPTHAPFGRANVYVRDHAAITPPMATYCTAKTSSGGCVPRIGATGAPTASGDDAFFVFAQLVQAPTFGTFFWSTAPAGTPFGGGTLCLKTPLQRTPPKSTGPVAGCVGGLSFHFSHAYMAQKGVQAGDTIYGQYWTRDGGFAPPNNLGLTGGLQVVFGP
ncbi:MAG: hypothetical protein L6Q99_15920 [Planctomycetes bacterium]|nr:hypothetical protein [Planctomycetota bacterium]